MSSRWGSHRNPISSEKCWLDFAVRELSRVAAGKAKGQEAVWRSSYKPAWWDSVCTHPWKNPTANEKDGKEVLKTKFQCLVKHLRGVGQVPREMEEEIDLWEKGRVQELFLLTSASYMLGQVGGVQGELDSVLRKVEESGVRVDPAILNDLHTSLSACLSKVTALRDRENNNISIQANKSKPNLANSRASCLASSKRKIDEPKTNIPSSKRTLDAVVSNSPPPSKRPKKEPRSHSTISCATANHPLSSLKKSVPSAILSFSDLSKQEQQKVVEKATMQKLLLQLSKRKSTPQPVAQKVVKIESNPHMTEPKLHDEQSKISTVLDPIEIQVHALSNPVACMSEEPSSTYQEIESTELGDFLELDVADKDDLNKDNFDFYDRLLEEDTTSFNTDSGSLESPELPLPALRSEVDMLALENVLDGSPSLLSDPLLCNPSTFVDYDTLISGKDQSPLEIIIDNKTASHSQTEHIVVEESPNRDIVSDSEVVSDSGYETSSPTSIRSSLDQFEVSFGDDSDLSSPDLEALLAGFPVMK